MASENILQELFELAKTSLYFKGLTEEDIWKACLSYQDRPDSDIQIAMENIRNENEKLLSEEEKKQDVFFLAKQKVGVMKQEEALHKQADEQNASDVLDNFFNS